jgi:hypothetical protein
MKTTEVGVTIDLEIDVIAFGRAIYTPATRTEPEDAGVEDIEIYLDPKYVPDWLDADRFNELLQSCIKEDKLANFLYSCVE